MDNLEGANTQVVAETSRKVSKGDAEHMALKEGHVVHICSDVTRHPEV